MVTSPLDAFELCWLGFLGVLSCARRKLPERSRTAHNFLIEISPLIGSDGNAIAVVALKIAGKPLAQMSCPRLESDGLNVTNQYLQATSKTKRLAQERLVDAILPTRSLSVQQANPDSVNPPRQSISAAQQWSADDRFDWSGSPYWTQISGGFSYVVESMVGTTGLEPATSTVSR
jgi:hypothetical protein